MPPFKTFTQLPKRKTILPYQKVLKCYCSVNTEISSAIIADEQDSSLGLMEEPMEYTFSKKGCLTGSSLVSYMEPLRVLKGPLKVLKAPCGTFKGSQRILGFSGTFLRVQ